MQSLRRSASSRHFGLNDASLRAKNAVLPIVYYLFHKGPVLENGVRGGSNQSIIRSGHREVTQRSGSGCSDEPCAWRIRTWAGDQLL